MIKVGKVLSVIKNDGFFVAWGKVLRGLPKMLKTPSKGDVLFITGGAGEGASALYRCHNQAEELNNQGIVSAVIIQDNPFLMKLASRFQVFIFHRPVGNQKLKDFISEIKKQNKEIIFETDDLLFDEKYFSQVDYLKNASSLEKKLYEKGVGRELISDPYVKTCVTTTGFLAQKLREKNKQVFVSANKLNQAEVEYAETLLVNRNKSGNENITIGYFSGSAGHDKDFETVKKPLAKIMEKYPNVRLLLAGTLKVPDDLKRYENRIVRRVFANRQKHFKNIHDTDLNIVPLEDNDFCAAKSELKFFEAGILEVPTIAFCNDTFRKATDDGDCGLLAASEDQWFEKMEIFIKNKNFRSEIGRKARQKTLKNYTTAIGGNRDYYQYLKNKINES